MNSMMRLQVLTILIFTKTLADMTKLEKCSTVCTGPTSKNLKCITLLLKRRLAKRKWRKPSHVPRRPWSNIQICLANRDISSAPLISYRGVKLEKSSKLRMRTKCQSLLVELQAESVSTEMPWLKIYNKETSSPQSKHTSSTNRTKEKSKNCSVRHPQKFLTLTDEESSFVEVLHSEL
jgi:hypothetical protein